MKNVARNATVLVLAAVAATLLVACGGSNNNDSTSGTGATPGSGTGAATAAGTAVTATEKEYSISLSTNTFSPGTYTFTVKNEGTMQHDLTIKGPGVDSQATPMIDAGKQAELTVTLQPGSYELWCSVPGHKQLGMDKTIQVG